MRRPAIRRDSPTIVGLAFVLGKGKAATTADRGVRAVFVPKGIIPAPQVRMAHGRPVMKVRLEEILPTVPATATGLTAPITLS